MTEPFGGAPADPVAAEWRERLEVVVRRHALGRPLLLSAGLDSGALLCAALAVGEPPPYCLTYYLEQPDGELPEDARGALRTAERAGVEVVLVEVPRDPEVLRDDLRHVICQMRSDDEVLKTAVQCLIPLRHMFREARDGDREFVIGTGGIVLDGRRVNVLLHQEGEEAAREYRRLKMGDRYRPDCGTGAMHYYAERRGLRLVEPYSEEPLREWALAMPARELMRPGEKGVAIRAYPDFWEPLDPLRTPLQVGCGIREWHDEVLLDPDGGFNRRGKSAVIAVYNDFWRDCGQGTLGLDD